MDDIEIFIVSLKNYSKISEKRTENLLKILKGFNRDKVNFIGINGLNLIGKKIKNKYLDKDAYSKDLRNHLGNAGCSLSHACILRIIQIKKIHKHVLVLEEDAAPDHPNFFKIFDLLPKDYDLALLHSYWDTNFYKQMVDYNFKDKIDFHISQEMRRKENLSYFKKIIYNLQDPAGASCYVVNGKNIDKIISKILPLGSPVDWHYWSNEHKGLNKYIINPDLNLCSQPNGLISIRHQLDMYGYSKNKGLRTQ